MILILGLPKNLAMSLALVGLSTMNKAGRIKSWTTPLFSLGSSISLASSTKSISSRLLNEIIIAPPTNEGT